MKYEITVNNEKVQKIVERFVKNPTWITGFVVGEACFTAYLNKQPIWQFPYQIQPAFIVVQHRQYIQVLYRLQKHFGCGQVNKNKGKNDNESRVWQWRVRDANH